MLKYGSAKAKFTANAICRQILELQAAPVVKADVRKAQHLLVHVAKEAVSVEVIVVVMIAEAAMPVVAIAEAVAHLVQARIVVVVTVQVVAVQTVAVVIAQAALQAEDN